MYGKIKWKWLSALSHSQYHWSWISGSIWQILSFQTSTEFSGMGEEMGEEGEVAWTSGQGGGHWHEQVGGGERQKQVDYKQLRLQSLMLLWNWNWNDCNLWSGSWAASWIMVVSMFLQQLVKWLTLNTPVVTKAVQDYDTYSICINYFEILWLAYSESPITIDYHMIWLWLQYDMAVIFNHIIIQQKFQHFGFHGSSRGLVAIAPSHFTINFQIQ